MTNYEKRLLKFLKDNPNIMINTRQIARIWKRKTNDVDKAMFALFAQRKVNIAFDGSLSLTTCDGIGGA